MNILITGACGFLGAALIRCFATDTRLKFNIFAVDTENYYSSYANVEYTKIELGNDHTDLKGLKNKHIDVIVHLIGSPGVWFAEKYPKEDLKKNVFSLFPVMELAKECNSKKIVFASSCQVLALDPLTREDNVFPQNNYGISKLAAENYLNNFSSKTGIKYSILRMSWLYGPRMKKNPMFDIIRSRDEDIMKVFVNPESRLDFIYIDDVVDAFYQATMNADWDNETVNVSSASSVKISYLISILEDRMGKKYNLELLEKGHRVLCSFDNSKAVRLGWRPSVGINEGFEKTLNFFMRGNVKNEA